MLHPSQFELNEAWIAFKLNDEPIRTDEDGDLDVVALMDAASCFIVGARPMSAGAPELTKRESKRLLSEGKAHKEQLPKILFIPASEPAKHLTSEAEHRGVTVVRVSDHQLWPIIGEARVSFREHFGSDRRRP